MKVTYREHEEYKWHDLLYTKGSIVNSLVAMEIAQGLRMMGSYPYGEVTFDIKIERDGFPDCHYCVMTSIDAEAVTKFVSTEIIPLPQH